jgi:hypothetical protein
MTSDQGSRAQARAQAEELIQAISAAESVIVTTIERECAALRAGCMLAARALHTRLCDAVRYYLDGMRAARASLAALEQVLPGSQDHLEERRAAFASVLKVELAVLASEYAACGVSNPPMSFTGESMLRSAMGADNPPATPQNAALRQQTRMRRGGPAKLIGQRSR